MAFEDQRKSTIVSIEERKSPGERNSGIERENVRDASMFFRIEPEIMAFKDFRYSTILSNKEGESPRERNLWY